MKKILLIVMALVALTSCGSKKDEVALVQQIDEQKLEQEASDYAFNEFVVKYKFLQQVYLVYKEKGYTQNDFRSSFGADLFEINMKDYDLEKVFVTNSGYLQYAVGLCWGNGIVFISYLHTLW